MRNSSPPVLLILEDFPASCKHQHAFRLCALSNSRLAHAEIVSGDKMNFPMSGVSFVRVDIVGLDMSRFRSSCVRPCQPSMKTVATLSLAKPFVWSRSAVLVSSSLILTSYSVIFSDSDVDLTRFSTAAVTVEGAIGT